MAVDNHSPLWFDLQLPPDGSVGLLHDDGLHQTRWPVLDPERVNESAVKGPLWQALQQDPTKRSGLYEGVTAPDGFERIGAYVRVQGAQLTTYLSAPMSQLRQRWWEHSLPIFGSFAGWAWQTRC